MEKLPIIQSPPEGKFKLQELKPDQTHPGITKTNGVNSIDVVYQNRFTLYDPETNTPKAVV